MQVEVVLVGLGHDLEALGVGLHEAVLDAVVDHLHEMPGPDRPDVGVAALGRQGEEDGLGGRDRLGAPAHHQAVAVLEAPYTAGGAGVDELDAVLGETGGIGGGVLVVRVAAVDDDVARLEQTGERGHGVLGGLAGGDHHPGHARLRQLGGQLLQARGRLGSVAGHGRTCLGPEVEAYDLVPVFDQAPGHVGAHLAEADHPDAHLVFSLVVWAQGTGPAPVSIRRIRPGGRVLSATGSRSARRA